MSYEEIMAYVELYFTTGVRWVCMGLAVLVLLHQFIALLKMRNPSEIWAYLKCPDDTTVPLTHWENLVGRHRGCDIILNLSSVSRSHGTLIRDSSGVWEYNDLNSKNGSYINGRRVTEPTVMYGGDVLTIGGTDFELYPLSLKERMEHIEKRRRNTKRTSPWFSLLAITIFQFLTVIQFHISLGDEFPAQLPLAFLMLCAVMWAYVICLRMLKRTGFEVEIIAFFLSTLSLAVTASAYPSTVFKQSFCILLGVCFFFAMCWFLRDLNKAKKFAYIFIGVSVVLLIANLALGTVVNGSQNWIQIGGLSFQPSEVVKIVFVFVGAASLDELQQRKNLFVFMGFSFFCLGCLAIMGDFGTAIIFFATFLVISFLRSGDFTKLILVLGAAALMGLMVLRFKPYVASRFETWGHVWEDPTGGGYQQVQTMTSIASGGIPGLGAGEGNLSDVAASSTDLVFGLLSEEWGLVIAILAVLCIITLGIFAYRSIIAGRSTYYCIAACATTTMFMFQTILNVFGSIDLLPLTGVTFPFVSSGGTSMIVCWGMLAFLKAADTRQNASLAVRVHEKHLDDNLMPPESMSAADYEDLEEFLDDLPSREISQPPLNHENFYDKPERRHEEHSRQYDDATRRLEYSRSANREAPARNADSTMTKPDIKPPLSTRNYMEEPAYSQQARIEPHRNEKQSKPAHPRAVKYTEISDEDFFGQFESGRPAASQQNRTEHNRTEQSRSGRQAGTDSQMYRQAGSTSQAYRRTGSGSQQDKPLTLEDIFGDDGIFGGDDK